MRLTLGLGAGTAQSQGERRGRADPTLSRRTFRAKHLGGQDRPPRKCPTVSQAGTDLLQRPLQQLHTRLLQRQAPLEDGAENRVNTLLQNHL